MLPIYLCQFLPNVTKIGLPQLLVCTYLFNNHFKICRVTEPAVYFKVVMEWSPTDTSFTWPATFPQIRSHRHASKSPWKCFFFLNCPRAFNATEILVNIWQIVIPHYNNPIFYYVPLLSAYISVPPSPVDCWEVCNAAPANWQHPFC